MRLLTSHDPFDEEFVENVVDCWGTLNPLAEIKLS